jgi:hypothetical protein
MSAHRYQSSFNGIIFNRQLRVDGATLYEQLYGPDDQQRLDPTYAESDYRLESVDLTRVTVEDFRELRQFLEGAEANESFEGVLIATGRGTIHAISPGDLEAKTQAMRAAFSPALVRMASVATDPIGSLPFDFKVDVTGAVAPAINAYSARRMYARPAIGRPVIVGRQREGLSRRFMFQLISFDPKVHSQTLHQQAVVLAGQVIANAGDFYAYPKIRITFTGAGNAALTVTCTTTGKVFVLDATTAAAGEVWILDTRAGLLTRSSDGANRYSQRVSGYLSELWLPAGNSSWTVTNTGGIGSVRFDYRDAWA